MNGRVQGLDVVFMGKAHVFPYDIAAYKQNRYLVDPLWRGVTVRTSTVRLLRSKHIQRHAEHARAISGIAW